MTSTAPERASVTDFQRLLAGIRLRAEQVIDIDAQLCVRKQSSACSCIDKTRCVCPSRRVKRQRSVVSFLPEDSARKFRRYALSVDRARTECDVRESFGTGDSFHIQNGSPRRMMISFTKRLFLWFSAAANGFLFVFVDSHYYPVMQLWY